MLRMSVKKEEYLLIGDDIKIVFLGCSGGQSKIMVEAPKNVNIVRSRAVEKRIQDPELLAKMPKYYSESKKNEENKKKTSMVVETN